MKTKIEFSTNFKEITERCVIEGAHLGGGNPNSKILLVGQESALEIREHWYDNNAKDWQNRILNNLDLINLKSKKEFPPGHTWSKYQKLHDFIFPEYTSDEHINFEERIFTTEMSDNPSKRTSDARKKEDFKTHLQTRKNTFFKQNFIQDFPVVVLACSDYIQNNDNIREIDDIFNVTYVGNETGKYTNYSKGNWFYLHYNEDKTKLVIHTRQLSTNVDNQMLLDMGKIIRQHLDTLKRQN